MIIGLISNRRSQRNKRGLGSIVRVLDSSPGSVHAELGHISELGGILRDFAAREVGVVAINGGDGTIQATLTELFLARPFEENPILALLPGGMTNMIAQDVGCRGGGAKALARLIAACAAGDLRPRIVEREVIRLQFTDQGPPIFGMFFGAAAIYRAILLCRRVMEPTRLGSTASVAATLATLLVRRAFRRAGDDPVLRGDDMVAQFDDGRRESGSRLVVLVTTLDRLVLKSRPFWGTEPGGLHYTAIAHPAAGLVRAVYPMLFATGDRRLPSADYVSRNANAISIEMTCPFTLDGELYEPVPGVPISLAAGQRARFLPC